MNLQKKDGAASYAGWITAGNPPSGPYPGTSFVWFPGEHGSGAVLVIGTDGFGADTAILGRPGHGRRRRALSRLHRGSLWVKPDLLDIATEVPGVVAQQWPDIPAAFKAHARVIYAATTVRGAEEAAVLKDLLDLFFHILTDKILADNAVTRPEPHLRAAGYVVRDRDQVLEVLARSTGVPRERILVVPSMPGEKTHHVDLFVMGVARGSVVVSEVRDDLLSLLTYSHEIELGRKVQTFLDEQAAYLAAQGLTVTRLPMVAPVFLTQSAESRGGWNGVFYSPTNALLATVGERRLAFLPTFDPAGFPEAYRQLNREYQAEWGTFFADHGFEPAPVDATALAHHYGLFRCLTALIPK